MSGPRPSILIVEDEYFSGSYLKTALAREGFRIIGIATSAAEAGRLAREEKPDIVLMDIRLVGADDGIEAALRIKTMCAAAIIFISGYQDAAHRERAMELGPLGYLSKPVLLRDILAVIERFPEKAAG